MNNYETVIKRIGRFKEPMERILPEGPFMNEGDALELIDQMKAKLGIKASREEILADYNNMPEDEDGIYGLSPEVMEMSGLKKSEEEIECMRRLYASGRLHTDKEGEFCPWLHAIASMYAHPDKICMSNSRCDQCHQPLITIWFRPSVYCLPAGFEGEVEICPSCMRQVSIDKRIIY